MQGLNNFPKLPFILRTIYYVKKIKGGSVYTCKLVLTCKVQLYVKYLTIEPIQCNWLIQLLHAQRKDDAVHMP